MIRKNRLEWRGVLTASQLQVARRGQRVALQFPDGSNANALWFARPPPALEAQSRLAIVYPDLMPGSRARAGMHVTGEIAIGKSLALVIPAECVVVRYGRSYVMELVGTSETPKVALRAVTSGRRNRNAIEILRGLTGKERLVLGGGAFLNDGDAVRVVGARKPRL